MRGSRALPEGTSCRRYVIDGNGAAAMPLRPLNGKLSSSMHCQHALALAAIYDSKRSTVLCYAWRSCMLVPR